MYASRLRFFRRVGTASCAEGCSRPTLVWVQNDRSQWDRYAQKDMDCGRSTPRQLHLAERVQKHLGLVGRPHADPHVVVQLLGRVVSDHDTVLLREVLSQLTCGSPAGHLAEDKVGRGRVRLQVGHLVPECREEDFPLADEGVPHGINVVHVGQRRDGGHLGGHAHIVRLLGPPQVVDHVRRERTVAHPQSGQRSALTECAQDHQIISILHPVHPRLLLRKLNVRLIQDHQHWQLQKLHKLGLADHSTVRVVRRRQKQDLGPVLLDRPLDPRDVQLEAGEPRHGHHASCVDGRVKLVHGEGRRTVDNCVAGLQDTPHEQVYELVGTAPDQQVLGRDARPRAQSASQRP
mmetsp:Transcript_11593/g.32619  ORF Transcript_11593/g.32619 Transcript_11593/m.32619 type:complete len:348 (-) Transcript_11593:386-1429(-)